MVSAHASRPYWALLAIPLLLVVAGCGSSNASGTAPTATPKVVTATPGPQSAATPKVVQVVVTATPHPTATPKPGHVTPVPGTSPIPPAPGLTLGEIITPLHTLRTIQAGANAGNKKYTFYRFPNDVIKRTLPKYGFKPPIDLVSPTRPAPSSIGRPLRKGIVKYRHTLYSVYVAQPVALPHGPKGIWAIVTIRRQHLVTGTITRPAFIVQKIQQRYDSGKASYRFWVKPTAVVLKTLPQYGFQPPYTLLQPAKPVSSVTGRPVRRALVKYNGDTYAVDVAQTGKKGPKGVWVIVTIRNLTP